MRSIFVAIYALGVVLTLSACGGRSYVYSDIEATDLVSRAEVQTSGPVTVSASVPGEQETEEIFGVPLYDQGVQPIWIEIHNGGNTRLRYAPVWTDRYYFSPLEVAWKNRGPYDDESRRAVQKRFNDLAMPRMIGPGQTQSGFVFSNFKTGVKAFNIELFGDNEAFDFTFIIQVPGFRPDFANVDFENLHAAGDFIDVDTEQARDTFRKFDCCARDTDGEFIDMPINVALVGEGIDILRSLLRGNWQSVTREDAARVSPSYVFGRRQDAIFRYQGTVNKGYYELRLWLTDMRLEGDLVWAGVVRLIIDNPWSITRPDPDVDLARTFLLQNMWYSQSLETFAGLQGQEVIPASSVWADLFGGTYFTDGFRTVMWLSAEPVSILDTTQVHWDDRKSADDE